MPRNIVSSRSPQMPVGTEVAAFRTHAEATAAVEKLSEEQFPLTSVTIVGSDLHMAEQILGRMTPARVALTGATQGLTWGLLMALFSLLLYPQAGAIIPAILIVVGILLGVFITMISWALRKNRGSFAAQSTLVASRYAVLVSEMPDRAFTLLSGIPGNLTSSPRRPVRREDYPRHQVVATPQEPTPGDPRWSQVSPEVPAQQDPQVGPLKPTEYGSRRDEVPRFGVRLEVPEGSTQADPHVGGDPKDDNPA